jgi:hypothetical protein
VWDKRLLMSKRSKLENYDQRDVFIDSDEFVGVSGVYSIMCMKQLASSENLRELKKGAFFRSWGQLFFWA